MLAMAHQSHAFLRAVWILARPYWFSQERWAARGLLLAIISLDLGLVFINVLLNEWNNLFYNSLQERDAAVFTEQIIRFSFLAAIYIVMAVYNLYLNQMLHIRWRRWLTENYLKDWLAEQTYYRLSFNTPPTDNPDQRIADDIRIFVSLTLSLSLGLLSALVTLGSFLAILWELSGALTLPDWAGGWAVPGYLVWVALLYAIVGTALTHWIGKPLSQLNFDQQRYEADFRFSLVRLRENAEGVALYGGEADESRAFRLRFGSVVRNWWSIMRCQKRLTWFTSGYAQVAVIFPYVVVAPRYFSGAIQLGGLMQTASAFRQVQESLSWFIDFYVKLAEWRATVERLTGFQSAIAATHAATHQASSLHRDHSAAAALICDALTLTRPHSLTHSGTPLLQADLHIPAGARVLISGASGSGKSTLFRALAGLWPFGSGAIHLPAGARLLFLPQKPYLPIAPLRSVVTYPAGESGFDDTHVHEALCACGLPALAEDLDATAHWEQCLSPGEQQRIAFARALLLRPDWLFLDEATSALDAGWESTLYQLLRQRLPDTTVISIGHRASLTAFHDQHLRVAIDVSDTQQASPARLLPVAAHDVAVHETKEQNSSLS